MPPAIALNMLRRTGGGPEYRRCREDNPGPRGRGNRALVAEGFATMLPPGVYRLADGYQIPAAVIGELAQSG